MENNEKFIKANERLETCARHGYLDRQIDEFRGKLHEIELIKMYLDAGVSPMILEQKFCEYFWATFLKLRYHNNVNLKEAEEYAGVAPIDYGLNSIEYLKSRRIFWQNECFAIERTLLTNVSDKELTQEEKEKLSKKIYETLKLQDKKIIAKYNAIDRYFGLTKLNQLKENIQRKNPQKINFNSMSVEEIDNLYRGKKK